MTHPALPSGSAGLRRRGRGLLNALVLTSVLPELILLSADFGLIGSPRWRPLAYQYGAFWAGLLHGWQPNFVAQPVTMFLTHAFLHTGAMHLIGNMLALVVLGQMILERHNTGQFILIYITAALGGGTAYGLLSHSAVPMVGASGAIFGLAGAQLVWRCQDQRAAGSSRFHSLAELCGGILGLVVINLLMWWIQGGQVAWQTHLGGALMGTVVAKLSSVQRPILLKIRS